MICAFLTASLPVLRSGSAPEMTVEEFDAVVRDELPEEAFRRLIQWDDPETVPEEPVYREMRRFREYLRYRIARMRAERLDRSDRFEIPEEFFGEVDHAVGGAVSATPLEREAIIDSCCWRKLDDLEVGHEMDFAHLCIYRIRLAMLAKYAGRDGVHGSGNFEAALDKLAAGFGEV